MECALTEASIRVSDGCSISLSCFFFFQAEDGIRDLTVTGVQTCALPIYTLQQLIVSTRRCRRIALLHPWCPASVSPALAARFPKSSAPTRDEATTRKEFLVAIHVAASLRLRARPADIPRCGRKRARSAGRPPCQMYSATPERKGRDGHRRPPGRGRRRSPLPAVPPPRARETTLAEGSVSVLVRGDAYARLD